MPIPEKYLARFEENGIYHVYNRTNNREKLFYSDENRRFFLAKYKQYLLPVPDTYCWCLLPNHFHFLVRIKPVKEITAGIMSKTFNDLSLTEKRFLENDISAGELTEQYFKRFFQSYALAFNKTHSRSGNLFYKPFKRVCIDKASQFTQALVYIHANPLKHGLTKDFTSWQWSSWQSLIGKSETSLLRTEVTDWFGDKQQMIKAHNDLTQYYYESDIAIED